MAWLEESDNDYEEDFAINEKIITVSEKQIDFLLGKYKVLAHLETIHHTDSEEAILDSDVHFVEFGVKKCDICYTHP